VNVGWSANPKPLFERPLRYHPVADVEQRFGPAPVVEDEHPAGLVRDVADAVGTRPEPEGLVEPLRDHLR
jgi:hypothetical protein